MNRKFTAYTDAALWQAFKDGDEEAFDFMFEKYVQVLYNYGRKFTAVPEIIEDCVQDLFVELWEKKKLLSPTDSIKFYLFKALRIRIIRRLSKDHTFGKEGIDSDVYNFAITLSYESKLISQQQDTHQQKLLTQAVNQLSKRQKEAIHLKYFDNLSYVEIAGIMAISVDSVYKLISGALAQLKKHMRQVYISLLWSSSLIYFLLYLS
ncbi:sigma-70 family RNA polymerase sigma factor [Rhodocytophaga aerolata]|uniref:Sigma-70 family RNA polymerase sigma factor n=1 Tax=Rhodocytophaga aerolata TaxID=455078 RepID=A0ABT8REC1_9BACT|nr:sigma-70 family RNA polymerase sigma factor [Rhodocytophaga aerolata]MDO1450442.1 sigma-70 family RNA polymerase sigma factor [Rhodocytophaga aerolata]